MDDRPAPREMTLNEQLMAAIERLEALRDHEPIWRNNGEPHLYPARHLPVKPDPVFGWLVIE